MGLLVFGDNFANFLTGGGGTDTLLGAGGNDTLVGGQGGDVLDGGSGSDTASYVTSLAAVQVDLGGANTGGAAQGDILFGIENVTGSTFGDRIKGNGGGNVLTGLGGNDTLEGRAGDDTLGGGNGNDRLDGGAGDDTYVVNSGGDVVDEGAAGSGGTDLVISAVTFNLRGAQVAGTQDKVENLVLSGNAAINGFGNDLDNALVGNGAANVLTGFAGNDVLFGGGGADSFVFRSALNANTNVDHVLDFDATQDTIRLENLFMQALGAGPLDPDAFRIGAAAADAEDRIIYNAGTGDLSYDADGAGGAAATRFAILDPGLAPASTDFTIL